MKRIFITLFALVIFLVPAFSCVGFEATTEDIDYSDLAGTTLHVYNWGEYISDGSEDSFDVNGEFEKLTGIKVDYQLFDSNESMYSMLKAGGVSYDIIIPSDYMIDKMISEDMLEKLDFDNIPNYKFIPENYKNLDYDPNNEYSVPYTGGKVGIVYNKTMVDEEDVKDRSWSLLWNEKYAGKILQFNNSRDAFASAQFLLGQNVNTTNTEDWDAAFNKLEEQKPLLQGYVMDEVFNKMETGEAAIATYYAGDYFTMYQSNSDLEFYYPEEGTNKFVDAVCIPKGSKNKKAAELYINFLLDPEVAFENASIICYECPNTAVVNSEEYIAFMNEELKEDAYDITYGEKSESVDTQIYVNLDTETNHYMNDLWDKLKTSGNDSGNTVIVISIAIIAVIICIVAISLALSNKRKKAYESDDEDEE